MNSVNVFHPSTQHSYQLALAIQKTGLLNHFITSIYYKPDTLPYSAIRFLPDSARSSIEKQLKRRFLTELNADLIHQYPFFELIRLAACRLKAPRTICDSLIRVCNSTIDHHVSRFHLDRISTVVGFSDSCLKTFEQAKSQKVRCVMDQPLAHIDTVTSLLKEEAGLHPKFANTIDYQFLGNEWKVARHRETELADVILCGSSFAKRSYTSAKIPEAKVFTIPYGVDLKKFTCPTENNLRIDNRFRILFCGSIGQRKGVSYLLEAAKQLNNKKIEVVLVGSFVGSKAPFIHYQEWFTHIPRLLPEDLLKVFQSADVLVLPSIVEGFGLVVLQAMACGLPAIVSENTCARDIVEDGKEGFVVPVRNVESLKEKIELLYRNPDLRREMGRAARRKAEQYTWERYQEQIGVLLTKLLTSHEF